MSFITITQAEMESLLVSKCGFKQVQVEGTKELVYERQHEKLPEIALRVYSSLTNGITRGYGEDAIRVTLVSLSNNKAIGSQTRTHRTTGWNERLYQKLRDMYVSVKSLVHCPCCHSFVVEREGKHEKFLGCSNYPNCKGVKRI